MKRAASLEELRRTEREVLDIQARIHAVLVQVRDRIAEVERERTKLRIVKASRNI